MNGDEQPPPVVQVEQLVAGQGGVGVQVRVDGTRTRRRSTVKSTKGAPRFTGRQSELRAIQGKLEGEQVVVIHGAPGLGKSRLAKEYAHRHADAYPGGMFFVPFDQPPPTELAKLLRDTDRPAYHDESVEDQCRRALQTLGSAGRTLLIYDSIFDEQTLREWLPYEGLDWHLIVTSTSARWAPSWSVLEVMPLQLDAARALVTSILSDDAASERLAEPIAAKAAGITIELCASAAAAREHLRRSRIVERVSAAISRETSSSFESAWVLLSPEAQLVLQVASTFVTPRFPAALAVSALQRIGWSPSTVNDAIDEARDRKLAAGDGGNLEVHQLVAQFVRTRQLLGEPIRQSLFRGLLNAARAFSAHPVDLDYRALVHAHSLGIDDWAALAVDDSEWHDVGNAVAELGRFLEACRWFERAVAAKENGDVRGHVDSESLGVSLHQMGYCYASQGRLVEALPWFERAVTAKENSDVHGSVNSASLGVSLHQLGYCYAKQGELAEALPWFERAVAAEEKGDVYGRVDSEGLGRSLHQMGYCYAKQGKFAEALLWFERAVGAAEKGDVHGRVDFQSLGVSLHHVGYCYARLRQFGEALPWFERAVAAAEKGDVHRRVDSESLGRSLHQVGDCYSSQGQFADALPWFARAVAAAEKGDVHRRVDSESLGVSLHQVGYCYSSQGQCAEALPWFERAVAAKEKGDVHGRVNSESLGTSAFHVAHCHLSLGNLAEARRWFEHASRSRTRA